MKSHPLFFLVSFIATVSAAQAVSLAIDFRTSDWSVNTLSSPQTVGDVTIFANRGNFTQNQIDGIGIDGGRFDFGDEIGLFEIFTVSFANSAGNDLTGVLITQLFDESNGFLAPPNSEQGFYSFNSTNWVPFSGTSPDQSGGELFVDFGGATDVTKVYFGVAEIRSDFSVAGFTKQQPSTIPSQVPDSGSTMILLGGTLLGFGGIRRYYQSKN